MVAQSVKVFLNEAAARLAKGTVSSTLIQSLITALPILVERDFSLGPETSIELMIRRILEEKLKFE